MSEAECFACHQIVPDVLLTELAPGHWRAVCRRCNDVLELDAGK